MSSKEEQQAAQSRTPRERLETAMQEVAGYRRDVLRMQQMDADTDERTLRGFQAALMNYYMELDLYRDESQLEEYWKEAELWRDGSGQWVTGFENLEHWNNSEKTINVRQPGLRRGATPQSVRSYMPPDIAIQISRQLDRAAKKLGFAAPIKESTPRTEINEELIEEVEKWRKQNLAK